MRIDFPELGDGQFVEIRDPKKLKWKEQKRISQALKDDSIDSQLDAAEKIALAVIKGGYLLDEDNRPISFPLNEQNILELPGVVIETVVSKFAELKGTNDQKN